MSSPWFADVGSSDELARAGRLLARLPSGRVVLVLADGGGGAPAALDAACYHHGGPLADGAIEDLGGAACVSCPWHKFRITLSGGDALYESLDLGTRAVVVKSKGVKQRLHVARARGGRIEVCDTAAPAPPGGGEPAAALGADGAALWARMRDAAAAAGGALESDAYAFQPNNSQRFACPGDAPRAARPFDPPVPLHSARPPAR